MPSGRSFYHEKQQHNSKDRGICGGVSGAGTDASVFDGTDTAEEKVGKILEQALERGGRDNVTLVLAQISGYEEKNILKRWAERHSTGR